MTGALIQLVAYGTQDLFLTRNPQITFFKMVYRRHTNFSIEDIIIINDNNPDIGKRITFKIAKNGDLLGRIYVVAILPYIPPFIESCFTNDCDENISCTAPCTDQSCEFAWVRRVGYALIKNVEVEIGNEVIDRHYGDYMNIWHELNITPKRNINKMIGDVSELITRTSDGIPSYKLFIPLQFWFCRYAGLSLPLISLHNNEVKINIEFRDFDDLYLPLVSSNISIQNDFSNLIKGEYIQQTVNGTTSLARYSHYDVGNKKIFYQKLSSSKFTSVKADLSTLQSENDHHNLLYKVNNDDELVNEQYLITGLTSNITVMPSMNATENNNSACTQYQRQLKNIRLSEVHLLAQYIFLDQEERTRFAKSKHEYLIEQVQYSGQKTYSGLFQSPLLPFTHPCKELLWVTQLKGNIDAKQYFNYSDSFINVDMPLLSKKNMINEETILFNDKERMSERHYTYFNWVQPYEHHKNAPSEGINIYSFALYPEKMQPSGTANMSMLDSVKIKIKFEQTLNSLTHFHKISSTNPVVFRAYARVYNVLRIVGGFSGLVFNDDNKT